MDRQFYHHDDLEEVSGGMWRVQRGAKRAKSMVLSADLMRDSVGFESAMMQALEQWPNSCRHNLTMENGNRLAWLGHAGCCIATASPEENTRCGWHTLNKTEQDEANRVAQKVLDAWLEANTEYPPLLRMMEQ